jgi:hypothetical protein
MKRFSTAIFIPAIIFFALSFFPAQSNGAPALSLSVAEEPVIVQRPFPVELTISWEGDSEQYLVKAPGLMLRWPGTGFQGCCS